ncbi:MAG: coproporphyrinogen dehydrogenase HemZ [Oscillospiraceae bacterium]|jgi:oxygen-independent coproporphyrinogen-3 oxidase|nr:coproporphyrinogen dehydrogenase HemZ [Oscillospiraceae bacterium]
MQIFLSNHIFAYEIESLCRMFFPAEDICVLEETSPSDTQLEEFYLSVTIEELAEEAAISLQVSHLAEEYKASCAVPKNSPNFEHECVISAAVELYRIFESITGFAPKWGVLTGVRPVKLMRTMAEQLGEGDAGRIFQEKYLVSKAKTELALKTLAPEQQIIAASNNKSYSLYIAIPFCPSRCSYCSFVSQSITNSNAKKLVEPYLENLFKELAHTAKIAQELGLKLETVYIGGGTPTVLSAEQLKRLLAVVNACFETSTLREFTVEAGRPDTITLDKLEAIKAGGVGRISVNPQSFNNAVLQVIGRKHSAEEAITALELAKSVGFTNINTDLIAGLPQDTLESFRHSIDTAISLNPESITVHTLAIKRASGLVYSNQAEYNAEGIMVADMLDYSGEKLTAAGYLPYYLYRQSKTLGNLENVGWSKQGFEGFYNVYIMDETHTILACGAGATSKLKQAQGTRIERIFNYKYPYEYNSRFDEILNRKGKVIEFYENLC